jgi:hypothetical protein
MDSRVTTNHSSFLSKKSYQKPSLHIYGTMEKITQSNSHTPVSGDNRGKANHKTGG